MKLEDSVASYDLCKKIHDIGVKKDSLFAWTTSLDVEFLPSDIRNENVCVYALTSAEIYHMIPNSSQLTTYKRSDNKYICRYGWTKSHKNTKSFSSYKLADAMAEMLIYLLENDLIKLKEINK